MGQTRKHFTAAEKIAILRRHLLEQAPVEATLVAVKIIDMLGEEMLVTGRVQG